MSTNKTWRHEQNADSLLFTARTELQTDFRPELTDMIENMEEFDTVILGYPNWWGTMPMAVHTLLDQYDFSGKRIIPFCTHEGSGARAQRKGYTTPVSFSRMPTLQGGQRQCGTICGLYFVAPFTSTSQVFKALAFIQMLTSAYIIIELNHLARQRIKRKR